MRPSWAATSANDWPSCTWIEVLPTRRGAAEGVAPGGLVAGIGAAILGVGADAGPPATGLDGAPAGGVRAARSGTPVSMLTGLFPAGPGASLAESDPGGDDEAGSAPARRPQSSVPGA